MPASSVKPRLRSFSAMRWMADWGRVDSGSGFEDWVRVRGLAVFLLGVLQASEVEAKEKVNEG